MAAMNLSVIVVLLVKRKLNWFIKGISLATGEYFFTPPRLFVFYGYILGVIFVLLLQTDNINRFVRRYERVILNRSTKGERCISQRVFFSKCLASIFFAWYVIYYFIFTEYKKILSQKSANWVMKFSASSPYINFSPVFRWFFSMLSRRNVFTVIFTKHKKY